MTRLDTYLFSCGHQFSVLKTESKTSRRSMTPCVWGPPKSLPSSCHECRNAELEAEEKRKESNNQVEAGIKAQKALIDFLDLQIGSPAAQNDRLLKSSFETCQLDALNKRAALVKESLLKSTWINSQNTESVPFEDKMEILQERVHAIQRSTVFGIRGLDFEHDLVFNICKDIKDDITKLQADYKRFGKDGFEKRLEQIMDKATELAK